MRPIVPTRSSTRTRSRGTEWTSRCAALASRAAPLAAAFAMTLGVVLGGAGTLVATSTVAQADPPPWAPAHGRRSKDRDRDDDRRDDDRRSDRYYRGYTGHEWRDDYGVRSGRCNTDTILAAVGAVAGGVIGNRTASDENRTVATILGAVIGGLIGAKVGDSIDDRDRACIGHSLELVETGRAVTWRNPRTGIDYRVRPTRDLDGGCREFELAARGGVEKGRACRRDNGAWEFRPR
jgi:surface antigen